MQRWRSVVTAAAVLSTVVAVAPGGTTPAAAASPFTDVPAGAFYTDAVEWLADADITTGTTATTFSPDDPVTRGQMATFLERYAQSKGTPGTHGFSDVPAGIYYDGPVAFLVEREVTTGTAPGIYSPDDPVTRAQMATFLWRFSLRPTPEAAMPFGDVPAGTYYYEPVRWLAETGVTTGTAPGAYSPDDTVTRGQMATFLWRLAGRPAPTELGANRIDTDTTVVAEADDLGAATTIDETGPSQLDWAGDTMPDVGDVVVLGITDDTPNGFIGKVTGTSGSMVTTTPATLQDAIPEADIGGTFDFDALDGLSQQAVKDAFDNVSASCGGAAGLDVDLDFDLDTDVILEASWSLGSGVEAFVGFEASATAALGVAVGAAVECEAVASVDGPKLKTITFFVGPVPVVLVPKVSLELVVGGSFAGSVSAGFTYEQGVNAGLRFADGGWSTEYSTTKDSFFTPPSFSAEATAGVQIRGRLDMLLYGAAGPYLTLGPFFELGARNNIPWWNIDAGLRASIGATIDTVFFSDEVEFAEVDLLRFRLADSGTTVPPGGLGVLTGLPLSSVDANGANGCGVDVAGSVHCWGDNFWGQIGDGTTLQRNAGHRVVGINDAVQVAVGGTHACALHNAGTVSCWGSNTFGELGIGSSSPSQSPTPVPVVGIDNAIEIEAGTSVTCAILDDYTVRCWGRNGDGQLGNGGAAGNAPVTVTGLGIVTDLAVGNGFTCAVQATGDAWCWGYNYDGQLGNGQSGPNAFTSTPVRVSGLDDAVEIDASGLFACARRTDGTAACWGANGRYELGNATTASSAVPVVVTGLSGVTDITAGGQHACALFATGPARCWGGDFNGQVGDGPDGHGLNFDKPSPTPVVNGTGFAAISAGSDHTCALLSAQKAVCWGGNGFGQLGDATMLTLRDQPLKLVQAP